MNQSLYELWEDNKQDMSGILNVGDSVIFNGKYFSDAHYFTKGKRYTVLVVEEIGIELQTDYPGESQFIFPDGLSSFNIVKEE